MQISRAISSGEIIPLDNGLIDVARADATYARRRAMRAAQRHANAENVEKRERGSKGAMPDAPSEEGCTGQ